MKTETIVIQPGEEILLSRITRLRIYNISPECSESGMEFQRSILSIVVGEVEITIDHEGYRVFVSVPGEDLGYVEHVEVRIDNGELIVNYTPLGGEPTDWRREVGSVVDVKLRVNMFCAMRLDVEYEQAPYTMTPGMVESLSLLLQLVILLLLVILILNIVMGEKPRSRE